MSRCRHAHWRGKKYTVVWWSCRSVQLGRAALECIVDEVADIGLQQHAFGLWCPACPVERVEQLAVMPHKRLPSFLRHVLCYTSLNCGMYA